MDWKLEVVIAPVADVERARAFYVDTLGFRQDSDFHPNEHFRAVQVTPPGLRLLDRLRHRPRRRRRAGLAQGRHPGGDRHRGGARLPRGARRRQHRTAALHRRADDAGRGPEPRLLRHLHLLRRPRRQLLGPPGSHAAGTLMETTIGPARGGLRAAPARAARALLPHARVVRRRGGRRPGVLPAGLALASPEC